MSGFPIVSIPLVQMEYRFGDGGPEEGGAINRMGAAFPLLEKAVPLGVSIHPCWERYEIPIRNLVAHIKANGLENPLIVFRVGGLYYTLVGSQRLCALRILAWDEAPCRVAPRWGGETIVFDAHPPKKVAWENQGDRPMGIVNLESHVNTRSGTRLENAARSLAVGDTVDIPHLECRGEVANLARRIVSVNLLNPSRKVTVRYDQCVKMT